MTGKGTIAILGTLDTKADEVACMKGLLEAQGFSSTLIDVGPLGPPGIAPDVSNEEVAAEAGFILSDLLRTGERGRIIEAMGRGAMGSLLRLFREGKISGVVGLGGNQGSAIAAMAMKGLPIGFPKVLVSTVASGNIRPYIGCKDIAMIFSVGDFLGGPNPVTRSILANAVAAVAGMAEHGERVVIGPEERTIAITALGNTESAASRAVMLLRAAGFQAIVFHASGAGGSAMEELVEAGVIQGVFDLTPHELTEEVVGGGAYTPVIPGRMKAAGAKGIPQVISTGALEYLCFGPRESIPMRLRRRKIYMHNPYNANGGVTRGDLARVGRTMADRLNGAAGPVAVRIPLRGWSVYGAPGGPLHDEGAYGAFLKALKNRLRPGIALEEVDAHINDPAFIDGCVDRMVGFMNER
jgi:uncharacterized protein (UPF0261 family)